MGMNFGYFLKLTHEPRWNTLTWTLDYTKNSDFDDNVGHWQVMKHPTKAGWTRVLYSTKVKLFPWIPNIVVKFITTKALVESTTWVKKESEKEAAKQKGTVVPPPTTYLYATRTTYPYPPFFIVFSLLLLCDYYSLPLILE